MNYLDRIFNGTYEVIVGPDGSIGIAGVMALLPQVAPTPIVGKSFLWMDSGTNTVRISQNGGAAADIGSGGGGGSGTVTSLSVTTANGISGSVANPTTTPAITLTLGAITPTTIVASGAVSGSNLSGTNTGDQTITLTGNVTGSGTGSFATTIAASVVTNAMLAGSIAASKLVGSDIATVGTITAGVWHGTPIVPQFGGTGLASLTAYSVLCGGTTGTGNLQQVSGLGTSGQVLTSNGAGALPTWQAGGGGSVTGTANQIVVTGSTLSLDPAILLPGTIELPNNTWLLGRNAANSADINVLKVDSSNNIQIGAANGTVNTGGTLQMIGSAGASLVIDAAAGNDDLILFYIGATEQARIQLNHTDNSFNFTADAGSPLNFTSNNRALTFSAGGNNQVLFKTNGILRAYIETTGNWTTAAGLVTNAVTKTGNYTTLATDQYVLVDSTGGAVTITLSSANATQYQIYHVTDWKGQSATNNITLTPSSGTINGAASKIINSAFGSIDVLFDGTNWLII